MPILTDVFNMDKKQLVEFINKQTKRSKATMADSIRLLRTRARVLLVDGVEEEFNLPIKY